jgi:hypothetical protein
LRSPVRHYRNDGLPVVIVQNLPLTQQFIIVALDSSKSFVARSAPMNTLQKTTHVLSVLAWALWMGGFTFFTSVSLRVAHKVLSEAQEFGYVTQVVTDRLNVIGLIASLLLLAQLAAHWQVLVRWRRFLLGFTWLIMAVTLAFLFNLHNAIDAVVNFEQRVVIDPDAFELVHVRYKQVATVQWLAAVLHLTVMLTASRSESRADQDAQ